VGTIINKKFLFSKALMWIASLKQVLLTKVIEWWIRSLRIKLVIPSNLEAGVLALWHRDLVACTAAFKDKNVHVLISQSADGENFAKIAQTLGYEVSRGSSSHGSLHIRHLLKSLYEERYVGMALDGPKGPAFEAKPGTLWLIHKSNRPAWMLSPHYGIHIQLKSWDKSIIPFPFSKIVMNLDPVPSLKKNANSFH